MKFLALVALVIPLGLGTTLPVPADNPMTPEKVALGAALFADTRLSRDGTIACTSCHDPQRAFTKPDAVSPGVFGRRSRRNSPTLLNRAWGRVFFWDGRAATLESQVLMPIVDPNEMDLPLDEASRRVGIPVDEMARALSAYIRNQMSGNSRFDRYVRGERTLLSLEEQNGLRLFRGRGMCTVCHEEPHFTDEKLHNTGVAWSPDPVTASGGRFLDNGGTPTTGPPGAIGAFKTPTLRDVARTAPYMHDGSMATLDEVVEFYDRGGRANPFLDRDLHPLGFADDDKRAIVAFLKTLSGELMPDSR